MLPRLDAGERLARVSDGAAAAGAMDTAARRRLIRRLEETERGTRQRAARATPAVLAGMGIGTRSAPSQRVVNDG